MHAGRANCLLTLQTRTETRTTAGDSTPTWANTAQIWGEIEPVSGSELVDGKQVDANRSVTIRTRYRSGVVPGMRFIRGSEVYNIVAVLNKGMRNIELEIACKEDA